MTTPTEPVSKTLRVNDLGLHYLDWGKADGPPIVCVHGYTGSADAYNALARYLQDRYRILALDVRGHGKSAWSEAGAYRYADQASDLAEFAKQLGLDKFVLIGTSMGGIIAMAYAAEHAERLLGLVINDIGPDPEAGTESAITTNSVTDNNRICTAVREGRTRKFRYSDSGRYRGCKAPRKRSSAANTTGSTKVGACPMPGTLTSSPRGNTSTIRRACASESTSLWLPHTTKVGQPSACSTGHSGGRAGGPCSTRCRI